MMSKNVAMECPFENRGNFETFRYIADETPPTKVFKLDNFDVDVSIKALF